MGQSKIEFKILKDLHCIEDSNGLDDVILLLKKFIEQQFMCLLRSGHVGSRRGFQV